jgi:hypothetical protein
LKRTERSRLWRAPDATFRARGVYLSTTVEN